MRKPVIVDGDPYLEPFAGKILARLERIGKKAAELRQSGTLKDFAAGHLFFGMHQAANGWIFREWAPGATGIWLVGTFSNWNILGDYCFKKSAAGYWELILTESQINHLDEYKLWITWPGGGDYRIPLYVRRVVQNEETKVFNAQVFINSIPAPAPLSDINGNDGSGKPASLIYEAHVGMSSADGKVSTYREFKDNVLPRIAWLGYNTIQLMAIQEHPYYGSFGYHVSNFFAVSSRFGTPDDLRELISKAHEMGLMVIMDIVHSHSVKNVLEGPGLYDGTPGMLFHTDHRREHPAWDSLCFDYGKNETIHFLLSNCRFWIEEYGFDGFRFDGVTSMLYYDHGLGKAFSSYDDYFNPGVDEDALVYLALANQLIHEINPDAVTIAEDMSGMPGLAASLADGGYGFDYRLSMGIPDFWIKLLKEKPDEEWNVSSIFWELTNRRHDERTISYAESHDQALVGDKTIIFRLADKEMYTHMSRTKESLVIDRAIALHKMIRMITSATHGGGYLNFMGNEFGHPEWIDFPRAGNDWSYHYARRQWHLADDPSLRYQGLLQFDKAMISLIGNPENPLTQKISLVLAQENDQVLAFERWGYLFVFNFHPVNSYFGYGIHVDPADYQIVMNTDNPLFDGFGRIDDKLLYGAEPLGKIGSGYQVLLYLPARTGLALKKIPPERIR